jgi:hypothetical protein
VIRKFAYRAKLYFFGRLRLRKDLHIFKSSQKSSVSSSSFQFGKSIPIYSDFKDSAGGGAGGHYFHQDLFFAREIYRANPIHHSDLGSRIDGFIAHLATFRAVNVFDIRSLDMDIQGVTFSQLDIMDTDRVASMPKIESLSCLHTAEHFGLGRYGDRINFDGWNIGLKNLTSLLVPGGRFYFSVPIGVEQRIEFNAHRIFNPKFMTERLMQDFDIVKTAAVRDDGNLDLSADFTSSEFHSNFDDHYGCGLWVLSKR